jgi:hypothetical protein
MVSPSDTPRSRGSRATRAAIGLTVKSGWTAAVLLTRTGPPLKVADSSPSCSRIRTSRNRVSR